MDFVERIFHLSPDGGSGATELAIFAAVLMAVALVVRFRVVTQKWRSVKNISLIPRLRTRRGNSV